MEIRHLKQIRERTFSHREREKKPSIQHLINAGFFYCNVGDRTICLYCNLICQQWQHTDNPIEVHKVRSPKCPFVLLTLNTTEVSPVLAMDYRNASKRQASFDTWISESSPLINHLVKAGFFYTGVQDIVKCFECGGTLRSLGEDDHPLQEHIKSYPYCDYAIRQYNNNNDLLDQNEVIKDNSIMNAQSSGSQPLQINDERFLSRLVAARLDLPMSRKLLNQNFKLSVVKRCWEDQLRLKQMDFASESDLFIACVILQKQIEHINGFKEKIVIPSASVQESNIASLVSQKFDISESRNSENVNRSIKREEPMLIKTIINHPCVACQNEEKYLACIPCGDLAFCFSCAQKFHICPLCHKDIEAFVRIYL